MQIVKLNSVRDSIQDELTHDARNDLLQHLLSRGARVLIFAGAVRDTILARECSLTRVEPRDWDNHALYAHKSRFKARSSCETRRLW
jgi:hypothetical protein